MRIAMLGLRTIGTGSGGVEQAVSELSTRLASRGHDITVFCRSRYNSTKLRTYNGVKLINVPAIYTKHLEAISHTFLAIWRTLLHYDVVHVHATGPSLLSFIPRLAGRRVVVTVHGLDWQREKWQGGAKTILRWGAKAAVTFPHRTIVVSETLREFYLSEMNKETSWIPNGVTPRTPCPLDRIARLGVEKDQYILYLGRLVPEKRCDLLIAAFKRLQTRHKLLIVGESSHSDSYVEKLRAMSDGDQRIVFAGALYDRDKAEAYSNAACLTLPSDLEGLPIVMLEAMSYACPVICSDIPPNLEVCDAQEGSSSPLALIFEADNEDSLLREMEALLSDPRAAQEMGERARDHVSENFSWDSIAEKTEAVYHSLVG